VGKQSISCLFPFLAIKITFDAGNFPSDRGSCVDLRVF